MSLFAPTPAGGGREILRQALRSRKLGLARIGRELGVATTALEAFLAGGTLPIDQLNAIAVLTFGDGVTLDPETDLLKPPVRPEPKPFAAVRPPSTAEMNIDKSHLVRRDPPKSQTPQPPARVSRPGWAD